jgi:hypothetical protein
MTSEVFWDIMQRPLSTFRDNVAVPYSRVKKSRKRRNNNNNNNNNILSENLKGNDNFLDLGVDGKTV